jgi:hypothetical protein
MSCLLVIVQHSLPLHELINPRSLPCSLPCNTAFQKVCDLQLFHIQAQISMGDAIVIVR